MAVNLPSRLLATRSPATAPFPPSCHPRGTVTRNSVMPWADRADTGPPCASTMDLTMRTADLRTVAGERRRGPFELQLERRDRPPAPRRSRTTPELTRPRRASCAPARSTRCHSSPAKACPTPEIAPDNAGRRSPAPVSAKRAMASSATDSLSTSCSRKWRSTTDSSSEALINRLTPRARATNSRTRAVSDSGLRDACLGTRTR